MALDDDTTYWMIAAPNCDPVTLTRVSWAATSADEVATMLRLMGDVIAARTPRPDDVLPTPTPPLVLLIDEATELLDAAETRDALADIVRDGGKHGIFLSADEDYNRIQTLDGLLRLGRSARASGEIPPAE